MRNPRNQLIIAMVFALLLGIIIVAAARCSSSGTPAARTPTPARSATPKATTTPIRGAGVATTVPGRATDVTIVPPGSQPSPSPTPINVGPLPVTTPGTSAQPTAAGAAPTAITVGPAVTQPAPTATTATTAGGVTYTVKAGDTLSAIARTYGTTVAAIAQANGISNTSKINAGQKLTIPGVTGPVASGSVRYYTVQPGDNLSRIAAKYGVTVDSIVKANKIANPRLIYSGTKLIIP